jgi:DNA mismatch repair protein MutL
MPQIQLLDEATIEKIAAGEVVERPSSVVKELVENAIDAGASFITVEIKEGGMSFLRITDNGCGIEKDQVRLAFLRHSTSKIRSMEDLLSVKSLGFRGEALASISAVAQVELITRPRGALTGVRYCVEGSKETAFEEVGAPEGTTFLVRNLFFNTPVRRKFLKSAQTEGGYVSAILERLALSHPEISFQLIVNNQPKLHTSGNCNRKDIIYHIYGRDIAANLLELCSEREGVSIRGYIGKPLISRGNRNYENYYINGRYMKSNVIARAIEEAYKPYLMNHQYPFTVLSIEMDESLLDVNVHPTKMDVRFADGEQVYRVLLEVLKEALAGRDLIPEVSPGEEAKKAKQAPAKQELPPQPFETGRIQAMKQQVQAEREAITKNSPYELKYAPRPLKSEPEEPKEKKPAAQNVREASGEQVTLTDVFREDNAYGTDFLTEVKKSNVTVIGQLFDTYWLVQAKEQLYIIDQHAAHEKVLFERNMRAFANRSYSSQQLSPPVIVSLTMQQEQALQEQRRILEDLGFEIEEFGGREYSLFAVPDNLYGLDAKQLLLDFLDDCVDAGKGQSTPEMIWSRIATASCKAAIKGNQRISRAEIEELLRELLTLENPYHCPHGRPTMISMSKYEIEKKFKRIV